MVLAVAFYQSEQLSNRKLPIHSREAVVDAQELFVREMFEDTLFLEAWSSHLSQGTTTVSEPTS